MANETFHKKTIKDIPLAGKTVLVRADYNVPLSSDGGIDDEYRITQSLPTLQYLLAQKCRIVLCSHLGRPNGKPNKQFSLEPVAARLGELLKQPVGFVGDCVGDQVKQAVKKTGAGDIILLENLRFHPEEEANDSEFAKKIAIDSGAEYLVQDGFGVVHRAHASTAAITHYVPAVAGLLLEKEYQTITKAMEAPKRPLVAVLGGAKISDKIKVFERFVDIADTIIIGGAMANTFLDYKGLPIGDSKYEDLDDTVRRIYEKANKRHKEGGVDSFLVLPSDVAVSDILSPEATRSTVAASEVQPHQKILDIGPESIEAAIQHINEAQTIIWNGTLGYAELPQFAEGSSAIAEAITSRGESAMSIIGGGDTADFILKWSKGDISTFGHVSTGGGASLELMEGKKLPGIEALLDA